MRKPVISRTFHGCDLKVLILNLDTREQIERTFYIERIPEVKSEVKKDSFLRRRIEEQLNNNEKFVAVLSQTPKLKRICMTEPEFIKLGHETKLLPGAEKENEEEQ